MPPVFLRNVVGVRRKRVCRPILAGLFLCTALTQRVSVQQVAVSFDMCARSEAWIRPSADVQSRIWNDPRYRDIGPNAFEWTHSFIPAEPDSESIQYSIVNLSGVWTDVERNRCPWRGAERGRWTEIWSLNYHVTSISLTGGNYTITVVPRESGYEIIQFRRPDILGDSMTTLQFVTADGNLLTTWKGTGPSSFDPR